MKGIKKQSVKKRGGARKGAGRKPAAPGQTKKPIFLYVFQSDIEKMGGEEALKNYCYAHIKDKVSALDA